MSEAWPCSLFGVSYPGLEHDWKLTLDLGGNWVEMLSGAPKWVPYSPANGSVDNYLLEGTVKCRAAVARALEGAVPPYGIGTGGIVMPVLDAGWSVPGITGTVLDTGRTQFSAFVPLTFQSKGQTGVLTDNYQYELTGRLPFDSNCTYTAQPNFLTKKFGTHTWKDTSVTPWGTTRTADVRSITYSRKKHGRVITGTIQLDHLTMADAVALVNYLRYIRGNYFASTTQSMGPLAGAYGDSPNIVSYAVCTKLILTRAAGLYFSAEMTCVLHVAGTSGPPVIWSIDPDYISNEAASTTITINGAGLYVATNPVVTIALNGTTYATTLVSATSGQVVVTAPNLPTAGTYSITLARDGLSTSATLVVYAPSSIILATGAAPVATALVNITKNSLVGLIAGGAVVADATTGVVAVGYAKDTTAAGNTVTIYQTGEATPVSGFVEGATVYLGANGNYISAPPTGYKVRQEVGTATATGVAVLCKEAVWA